jgi:zinc-ribbon domain
MIISCPSCATRYQWSEATPHSTLTITCRVCGHGWNQNKIIDIYPDEPANLPATTNIDHRFEPEQEVRRLVEAARDAKDQYRELQKRKMKRLRAWATLGFLTLTPIVAAAAYPAQVVAFAPITIKAYEAMGMDINIYGLEIRRLTQQYAVIDGQRVLTIKGDILNISGQVQKIPSLRFGLNDLQQLEVYQWTLDTGSRPLRAGESTSFITRVASPPETASQVKIRFAHPQEISSNASS